MKKALIASFALIIISFSSCKKCYHCTQYSVYYELKTNPGFSQKYSALKASAHSKVDSFYNTLPDSVYNKNKLQDEQDVCGNKNAIDDATTYYLKQDYYCNPLD